MTFISTTLRSLFKIQSKFGIKKSFSALLNSQNCSKVQTFTKGSLFLLNRTYASAKLTEQEAEERTFKVLKNFDKVMPEKLSIDTPFTQLGLDSLDVVEVMLALEEEFHMEIPDNVADKADSPRDIAKYVYEFLNPKEEPVQDFYSESEMKDFSEK